MSDLDLDAIKVRCEAATPGPWETADQWSSTPGRVNVNAFRHPERRGSHRAATWEECGGERIAETSRANAEFIAHARSDMPALVTEVERMADALWAICDGDGSEQDRIIAASALGDRYDHSKPHGR
jgi:hypothetical protein